jgi:hypothetical protein
MALPEDLGSLINEELKAYDADEVAWHQSWVDATPRTSKTFFYLCRELVTSKNTRIRSDEADELVRSRWARFNIPHKPDTNPIAHFVAQWTKAAEKSCKPHFKQVLNRTSVNADDDRPYYIEIQSSYFDAILEQFHLAGAPTADNLNSAPLEMTNYSAKQRNENARHPQNQIYYGPPGTGKTFALQKMLDDDYASLRQRRTVHRLAARSGPWRIREHCVGPRAVG